MASINGISIKSVKTFVDHEGAQCAQGNVYKGKKKLGFWSQDSWGGPDRCEFNESELDDAVKDMHDGTHNKYRDIVCLETFMGDLLKLIDYEKEYKKCLKKNLPVVVFTSNGFRFGYYAFPMAYAKLSDEELIEKCKEPFEAISIFRSLDEFNLTVDAENPLIPIMSIH